MISDVAKLVSMVMDRKVLVSAIAQVFDVKSFSREVGTMILNTALKQKDVVIDALAHEFSQFLQKINITEEAQKALQGLSIDVKATVEFNKKSKGQQIKKRKRGK